MSLQTDLANKIHPKYQNLDRESLDFICSNMDISILKIQNWNDNLFEFIFNNSSWQDIELSWYDDKQIAEGIHGLRHAMRVAINIGFLTFGNDKYKEITKPLIWAALKHDCSRKNDNEDLEHGLNSARSIMSNSHNVPKDILPYLDMIAFSVENHNVPYAEVEKNKRYLKNKEVTDLLKTADALDRYRLPKIKWWPNTDYLKIIPNKAQLSFAYYLMDYSEREYLNLKNDKQSIIFALKKMRDSMK